MKSIKMVVLSLIIYLLLCCQAFATATYDYYVDLTISFNMLWDNYTQTINSPTVGTGQHYETSVSSPILDPNNFWNYQSSHVTGSVGDDTFSQSGTSGAYNSVISRFYFDFDGVPTDLIITLEDWNWYFLSSRQLELWDEGSQTGEKIGYWPKLGGGGGGFHIWLDGGMGAPPNYEKGESATFSGLTGQHIVELRTSVNGAAKAVYPYVKTPEPATMLLLGSGLVGLAVVRRKLKRKYMDEKRNGTDRRSKID